MNLSAYPLAVSKAYCRNIGVSIWLHLDMLKIASHRHIQISRNHSVAMDAQFACPDYPRRLPSRLGKFYLYNKSLSELYVRSSAVLEAISVFRSEKTGDRPKKRPHHEGASVWSPHHKL
jgi:hypothetical protein